MFLNFEGDTDIFFFLKFLLAIKKNINLNKQLNETSRITQISVFKIDFTFQLKSKIILYLAFNLFPFSKLQ